MTWRQWLNNALKRSYGIFGEGVEYSFLHVDDKVAYIRVNHVDKDTFSSSISTYISTDELVGSPLTVSILQESSSLRLLEVTDDDRLWLEKSNGRRRTRLYMYIEYQFIILKNLGIEESVLFSQNIS
ncbi:Pop8p [Saccharomyces cerevisiae AWRI796]|nr:Pop8p [Saccharomyces cerevisiae AWRI796]